MVAIGRSASARIRRTCRSAPVSISSVDSWRWCRNVGGSPSRPRCSWTTSEVAPGQAKKPVSRWVSSGTSAPPAMTPVAPASTAARVASRASSPSISSCAWAIGLPARGAARPRRRQPVAAEGPPDAPRGDGHHDGQHRQQRDRDDEGDDEAREPRGGVGALQRALLARRAEDAAEAVDHEVDPQQQRDGGQDEGRRPQVAPQPAVQQARGDEAAGRRGSSSRSMPASHGRSSDGAASIGGLASGRHASRRARAPCACRRRSRTRGRPRRVTLDAAALSRAATSSGSRSGRGHHDDHLRVGPPRERAQRVGELGVGAAARRRARAEPWQPGATRRPQTTTMPGPCHSSSRRAMSRQAARELSVGLGREQQVADHLDPPAQRRRGWCGRPPAPCRGSPVAARRRRCSCRAHRVTFGGPTPPHWGGSAPPEGGRRRR